MVNMASEVAFACMEQLNTFKLFDCGVNICKISGAECTAADKVAFGFPIFTGNIPDKVFYGIRFVITSPSFYQTCSLFISPFENCAF